MCAKYNSYKDLPRMPITSEPSTVTNTGLWRTYRPVLHKERCIKCRICWKYCPDVSIQMRDDTFPEIDYGHCKGCGICANECPKKAIEMVLEE